jgi:ATP sulfurylase
MGCSHFIIGRDHTGVGDFYKSIDYRSYFEELGDIGIEPVIFDAVGYNPKNKKYEKLLSADTLEPISGTKVREAFQKNTPLPDWFMREIIQESLREDIATGRPIFYE